MGISVLVLLLSGTAAYPATVGKVVAAEVGYNYTMSADGLSPADPSGVQATLYYGYLIGESPTSNTVLSLVLGYEFVTSPYFELASAQIMYPSLSLPYQFRF